MKRKKKGIEKRDHPMLHTKDDRVLHIVAALMPPADHGYAMMNIPRADGCPQMEGRTPNKRRRGAGGHAANRAAAENQNVRGPADLHRIEQLAALMYGPMRTALFCHAFQNGLDAYRVRAGRGQVEGWAVVGPHGAA